MDVNRFWRYGVVCFGMLGFFEPVSSLHAESAPPNVVVILTDNHGAWTLGCYGNPDIRTPHIDQLASEGALFTRAFASNPVCSPTRATLLTGLLPSQHGVHCFLRGGRLQVGPDARNTLEEFRSLPEILDEQGYACGLVGKWHLGANLSPQEKLDDYWVTMPHGGTSTFYDANIIENGQQRKEPQYLTDFWTRHAVEFIRQNKEKPFFLFLSYNGPYALSRLLTREGQNRHAEYYRNHPLNSFPREPVHPWQFSNRDFINDPTCIRRVATEVSGVDDGVGTVMAALKQNGLDENTIVIFLADQGWVGGHGGYFGMGDHTRPLTARDGMMQIPMIWRHPGQIPAGRTIDQLVANYDVLPTLLDYLDVQDETVAKSSPGHSVKAQLRDAVNANAPTKSADEDAVYYEFENLRCIRTADWKYVHRHPNGPHELFDLKSDPEETENLIDEAVHDTRIAGLKRRLDGFYERHADPQYDLWNGGASQTVLFDGIDEELAQVEPAEPPPTPKGFVQAELKVPEEFTVELAAGPPLVAHPMMGCFDDRGRLFLAESAGLNMSAQELEEKLPNLIRMLEDTDRDGRFDRSTVFADKLTLPQGAVWLNDALYVASPPNIWRFEDADGDGVAEKRDIVVGQFGYTGNAASIHGCFAGPDGRIYWCDGRHGHEFKDEDGKVTSNRDGSYIFSARPDGSDVRIHCGGGMDNPVEVDFTDTGEMLGTVNILYSRPRNDCLVHWQYGGAYPHHERVLGELTRTGDLLGPVYGFGHVAVSGMLRYRSGVLDRSFRDSVFVTIFNSGKVQRVTTAPEGSTYKAELREFLTSEGRDFHPTDVIEDADGSLLVVDTGGWFVKGCPTSQIAKPELKGGIYRVRRRGATPLVDPFGAQIRYSELSDAEVVRLLNDTRFKVREASVRECSRRGDRIVPLLATTIARRDLRESRNAVWALTGIESSASTRALETCLSDPRDKIRLTALHAFGFRSGERAVKRLEQMLSESNAFVRRAAARALGEAGMARSVQPLLEAAATAGDRTEEHAAIHALIEIDQYEETAERIGDGNLSLARAALIACDQMASSKLKPDDVLKSTVSADPALQKTALEICRRRQEWSTALVQHVGRLLDGEETEQARLAMTELLPRAMQSEEIRLQVGRKLQHPDTSRSQTVKLFEAIDASTVSHLAPLWKKPLQDGLASSDRELFEAAFQVVATRAADDLRADLQRIAGDESRSGADRLKALRALNRNSSRLTDPMFDLLMDMSRNGTVRERGEASQLMGGLSLTDQQAETVLPLLADCGPVALRNLIRIYGRGRSETIRKLFLKSIGNARSFDSLPVHEFSDIIKRYPVEELDDANMLLSRLEHLNDSRAARLEELTSSANEGNVNRGRELFASEKAKCGTCHQVGGKGGKVGPDLTRIGRIRSKRDLMEAIVFPSASFVRDYEAYSIVLKDGRVVSGLILRETEDAVVVQQQLGEPLTIRRSDIEQQVVSPVSIMPKGLEKALSEEELADVIAYLQSLK